MPSWAVTKSALRTVWPRGPYALCGDERERRLVADPLERTTGEAVEDLGPGAEHALDQRLGEDRTSIAVLART